MHRLVDLVGLGVDDLELVAVAQEEVAVLLERVALGVGRHDRAVELEQVGADEVEGLARSGASEHVDVLVALERRVRDLGHLELGALGQDDVVVLDLLDVVGLGVCHLVRHAELGLDEVLRVVAGEAQRVAGALRDADGNALHGRGVRELLHLVVARPALVAVLLAAQLLLLLALAGPVVFGHGHQRDGAEGQEEERHRAGVEVERVLQDHGPLGDGVVGADGERVVDEPGGDAVEHPAAQRAAEDKIKESPEGAHWPTPLPRRGRHRRAPRRGGSACRPRPRRRATRSRRRPWASTGRRTS